MKKLFKKEKWFLTKEEKLKRASNRIYARQFREHLSKSKERSKKLDEEVKYRTKYAKELKESMYAKPTMKDLYTDKATLIYLSSLFGVVVVVYLLGKYF